MTNLSHTELREIFDMWVGAQKPAEQAAIAHFAVNMNASDQAQLAQIIMEGMKIGGGYMTEEIIQAMWPRGYAMQVAMYDGKTRAETSQKLQQKFGSPSK